jgi:predicted lipoprotein with Yx(FWY)xxD motif
VTRSKSITSLAGAALLALATLFVSACGGGSSATVASQPKPAATPQPAAVAVAKTRLGHVLVDSRGRTLYLFTKDSGSTSACLGACAMAWPPLRAGDKPTAGRGAKSSLVGTTTRSDGGPQVTYDGHPLYTFIKDKKAGDTNGEGLAAFGGSWFVVSRAGTQVSAQPSKPASGASSSPPPAATATPAPTPAPTATPPASNGIPQNNGGDHDSDNNGGPSDGDGGV